MAPDGSGFGSSAGPVAEDASEKQLRTGGDFGDSETGEEPTNDWTRARDERVAALQGLEREIVTAAARVAASTQRLLTALRAFDEQRGWEIHERKSTADWLSWRAGMSLGVAREHVRVARALGRLPRIDEALRTARISYSKARALTRVATPENESELLITARCATAHQLEKACRNFRHVSLEQVERKPRVTRAEARKLRFRDRDDGYVDATFTLPPVEADELRTSLDATLDHVRALAAAAARAAEASGPEADSAAPLIGEPRSPEEEQPPFNRVDALLLICRSFAEHPDLALSARQRCELFVEVQRETLSGTSAAPALLADGTALSPETARRLACDTAIVPFEREGDGTIRAIGGRSRTVPSSLARALRLRDRHCRFPGCASILSLDAHHVVHWARGGPTEMGNLVRLCAFHHWCMHEGGCTAAEEEGRLVFRNSRGEVIENAPSLLPDEPQEEGYFDPLAGDPLDEPPDSDETLPVPIGGPADWSIFIRSLIHRTYGPLDGGPVIPRMPLPDGSAPAQAPPPSG